MIQPMIQQYEALRPYGFPLLSRFDLSHNEDWDGGSWLSLRLELRSRDPADLRRLVLTFTGVRNLRFTPADGLYPIPLYLEIIDIHDRRWEGMSYQVFNSEQDVE